MLSELGGLNGVRYLLPSEISSYQVTDAGVTIVPKQGFGWKDLITTRYGATIVVTPDRSESGVLYTISGTISMPPKQYTNELERQLSRMDALGAVICYSLANGVKMVVGSQRMPVRTAHSLLTSNTASGASGIRINLSGKSLRPQLPLL